jgi:chaperonin GroEL
MSISSLIHGVLQNAASIAGLMLTTGWMVADWPEDKPSVPMGGGERVA